jgi:hypothetical protein
MMSKQNMRVIPIRRDTLQTTLGWRMDFGVAPLKRHWSSPCDVEKASDPPLDGIPCPEASAWRIAPEPLPRCGSLLHLFTLFTAVRPISLQPLRNLQALFRTHRLAATAIRQHAAARHPMPCNCSNSAITSSIFCFWISKLTKCMLKVHDR